MFFTVYRTTNKLNGKTYVGKHKTNDLCDGYLGSGFLLKKAIRKYGIKSFEKEIIAICGTTEEMNELERALVVISDNSYNLKLGGHGGFDYINAHRPNEAARRIKLSISKKGKPHPNTLPGSKAGSDKVRGKSYEDVLGVDRAAAHKKINSEYMKNKNPNEIKVTCPKCGKIGSKPPMARFHFEFCKHDAIKT